MSIPALSAAKRLCENSGWTLTNLGLQKILYLAHMAYLGYRDNPLVDGHFEAWDYGPVHPEVYHRAKIYGSDAIGNIFRQVPDLPDSDEKSCLDFYGSFFSEKTPAELVAITHDNCGAWAKNYRPTVRGIIIPDQDIKDEFRTRQEKFSNEPNNSSESSL